MAPHADRYDSRAALQLADLPFGDRQFDSGPRPHFCPCLSGISDKGKYECFSFSLADPPKSSEVQYYRARDTELFTFSGRESPLTPIHSATLFTIHGKTYESINDFVRERMFHELTGAPMQEGMDVGRGFRAQLNWRGVSSDEFDRWALQRGLQYMQMAIVYKAMADESLLDELRRSSKRYIAYTYSRDEFYGTGERNEPAIRSWRTQKQANISLSVPINFPIDYKQLACTPQIWKGGNVLGTIYMCLRQKIFVDEVPLLSLVPYVAELNVKHRTHAPMPPSRRSIPLFQENYGVPVRMHDSTSQHSTRRGRVSPPRERPPTSSRRYRPYEGREEGRTQSRQSTKEVESSKRLDSRSTYPQLQRPRPPIFNSVDDLRSSSRFHSPDRSVATTPPRPERLDSRLTCRTPVEEPRSQSTTIVHALDAMTCTEFAARQMQDKAGRRSSTGGQLTPCLARMQLQTPDSGSQTSGRGDRLARSSTSSSSLNLSSRDAQLLEVLLTQTTSSTPDLF